MEKNPKYAEFFDVIEEGGSHPYRLGDWKKANQLFKEIKPELTPV